MALESEGHEAWGWAAKEESATHVEATKHYLCPNEPS